MERGITRRDFVIKAFSATAMGLTLASCGGRRSGENENISSAKKTATNTEKNPTPDICQASSLPIVFEHTPYNQSTVDQIESDIQMLPNSLIRAVEDQQFQVIFLGSIEEVQKRLKRDSNNTDSETAAAYMSPNKKEIVVADTFRFPHELAHAVDYSLGYASLSESFIPVAANRAQRYKPAVKEDIIELKESLNQSLPNETRSVLEERLQKREKRLYEINILQQASQIPFPSNKEKVLEDEGTRALAGHMFTEGFLVYYYRFNSYRNEFKNESPDLYKWFEVFDTEARDTC